ncbi:MAG: hypothetical protein JJE52_03960 [Acidimicrobiia bacterium]|nr:hypothetical protein [Acidimicrobiia bacterium]
MERERLEEALETLGDLLAERGQNVGLLVVGGSSLLLLGYVERPTADVDVVGLASPTGYVKADRLPQFLADAVGEVGRALGVGDRWLNVGPAALIDFDLPGGTADRVTVRRYGSLEVHLPAREDPICFKLDALVDQGPRSKHMDDLRALGPSPDELVTAAQRTRTHDPSVGFLGELREPLALFEVVVGDGDL